jgi:hypothetical protein
MPRGVLSSDLPGALAASALTQSVLLLHVLGAFHGPLVRGLVVVDGRRRCEVGVRVARRSPGAKPNESTTARWAERGLGDFTPQSVPRARIELATQGLFRSCFQSRLLWCEYETRFDARAAR